MKQFITYNEITGEAISATSFREGYALPDVVGFLHLVVDGVANLPGYVAGGQYFQRPQQPSPDHTWDVTAKEWVFMPSAHTARIEKLSLDALDQIDQTAGRARLKYITSVPGQAETYQRKEQQAREWKAAGYAGTPPVFVGFEAAALGQDPVDVADYIIETADQWGSFKGPQIEAMRRKWKVAIEQAGTDEVAIRLARDSGLVELMAL